MNYNLKQLRKEFQEGKRPKFLFFWGHTPPTNGATNQTCFSQWFSSKFTVDSILYPTAEHWMMAEKARLFKDAEMLARIIVSKSPGEAKKLGRQVKGFDPEIWDLHKYEIVKQGSLHKFSQNKEMKNYLLTTKNRVLVEASPRDRIWGIGMGKSNEKAMNPLLWRGQNLLGFALMEVRDELVK